MRTSIFVVLALAAAACSGDKDNETDVTTPPTDMADTDTDSDADADTDADADADADTDSDTDADADSDTDADTSTPTTPATRDGTYIGTLNIDATESGFVLNQDSCTAPLTLVVDSTAPTLFTGIVDCPFTGMMGGTIRLDFAGALITVDPAVGGTVEVIRNQVDVMSALSGSFQPDGSLQLAVVDQYGPVGDYALTWNVSATLTP